VGQHEEVYGKIEQLKDQPPLFPSLSMTSKEVKEMPNSPTSFTVGQLKPTMSSGIKYEIRRFSGSTFRVRVTAPSYAAEARRLRKRIEES
jgi:hypothetical protein